MKKKQATGHSLRMESCSALSDNHDQPLICDNTEADGTTSPVLNNVTMESSSILQTSFSIQRPPSFLTVMADMQRQHDTKTAHTLTDTPILESETFFETQDELPNNDNSLHCQMIDGACFELSSMLSTSTVDSHCEETGRCIECVKAIPVFSAADIEKGDHITFAGAIYDHHAIVVDTFSDNSVEIIEATNTFSGVVVGISKFFGQKAKLVSSRKTFNFTREKIRVIFYKRRRYSKFDTVNRAKKFFGNCGKQDDEPPTADYKYDLFENNCEHFATYCVTGEKFSIQVTKLRLTAKLFLSNGFIGISDEKKRNEKEFENNIICESCFKINQKLLEVPIRTIRNKDDVQKGDVIRFSYWNLWHEAVVLEISEVKSDCIKCFIGHYAFCGLWSHRKIIKELISINFNGSYRKLEYNPPLFHVYDPETVVHRAESRIGEQMFVFFSNDSSHFVRWCKLKLKRE